MTIWTLAALATFGLILSLLLLSFGFRRLYRCLERWGQRERPQPAAHRCEIFQGQEIVRGCVLASRVLRISSPSYSSTFFVPTCIPCSGTTNSFRDLCFPTSPILL